MDLLPSDPEVLRIGVLLIPHTVYYGWHGDVVLLLMHTRGTCTWAVAEGTQ